MKINIKAFKAVIAAALAVTVTAVIFATVKYAGTGTEILTDIPRAEVKRGHFTVLVAGCDRVSGLTDVMMIVSADTDVGGVSVLQIPRDTYAVYSENGYKKINGAYARLGGEGLKNFISDGFGVEIDRYMVLSPDAFCYAVDALGGIEVELTKALYYNDPAQELYIHITKGRHRLDGKGAEQLVRYRAGYADGDLGRVDTQKVVMCALMQKILDSHDDNISYKLFDALNGRVDTDITLTDVGLLSDTARKTEQSSIFFVTAPGRAVTAKTSGASFYVLSAPAMNELRHRLLGKWENDFDRDRVFLNGSNADFSEIYRKYSEYAVYGADDIAKNGIGSVSY